MKHTLQEVQNNMEATKLLIHGTDKTITRLKHLVLQNTNFYTKYISSRLFNVEEETGIILNSKIIFAIILQFYSVLEQYLQDSCKLKSNYKVMNLINLNNFSSSKWSFIFVLRRDFAILIIFALDYGVLNTFSLSRSPDSYNSLIDSGLPIKS